MSELLVTTSEPRPFGMVGEPLVDFDNGGGKVTGVESLRYNKAYLHAEAEDVAGYDIPIFIDGDMLEMEKPPNYQRIILELPEGRYKLQARIDHINQQYLLVLKGFL